MDLLNPPPGPDGDQPSVPRRVKPASGAVYASDAYIEAGEGPDAELGLFRYWGVIRRNRGKILLASFGGLIVGFGAGMAMTKVYRATTTIEILAMNDNFMNMRGANPVDNSTDSDVSEEQTQAELLTSAAILKRVAARLDPSFARVTSAAPSAPAVRWLHAHGVDLPDGLLVALHQPTPGVTPRSRLISKAARSLKVRQLPHTRIIEATADSSDPKLDADFLNTLAQEFIQQNQDARLTATQHTGDWLSRELGDARDRLRQSENAVQEYARTSGLIYTNETTNVATEKLQQYQLALSGATADRIAKQARFELAQSSPPDSLADIINDAALRDLQSKITDLRRQSADLSIVFSPEYSKLRRVDAELQPLQAAFDRERADVLGRIKTDYEEASRKERLLIAAYDAQTTDVTGQGEKAIQYNILKRDVDSNRQLYDAMLQQMKQASIATAMRASNVRVVDESEVPRKPVSPNFPINSAIGFLGGLVLSTIVVLVRSEADRTLHAQGDIKQWAELPELGTIPNARGASKVYYLHDHAGGSHGRRGRAVVAPDGGSVDLAAWQGSASLLAESFRCALTSILFTAENSRRPQVLVFASGNPAEGKTTTVANIAIAASEINLKVLVIDADLRCPRVHKLFHLPTEHGLADCLRDGVTDASLAALVRRSAFPNLHVVTSEPAPGAATQLLHSPNFADLIKRFRAGYDMILIDTPPMLNMPDARVISRQADGVVLVARAGRTAREALLAAKERFEEDGTPVIGSILNDWDPKRLSDKDYRGSSKYVRSYG
jgi:polysaccharide biosynthesis transport protein